MSLPDSFLDELRSRLSLAAVVGRKVTWDARKSNRGKGDFWAPCPFHQEKTASFHVDDRKGFFYCFGCHAKGDAFGFVQQTENVGFAEAVEILAREAGMAVPARDPAAQAKTDRRTRLAEVMERAVGHYRLQLRAGAGSAARAYLAGRGLDEETLARWEIGFAPESRQGLAAALAGDAALLEAAGLVARRDDGSIYDRFRDRIMFPIRDPRGRCIAFGGRAMRADAPAKYLNSPQTELFDKGRTLYNHGPAREAVGRGEPLVVVEGYMDAIALGRAGLGGAVAPLGTALTEEQLELLWRIAPEPVLAFDGDAAGMRAALRVVDLALPRLGPGRSLRFCLLPAGQDPDDLLRTSGAEAVRERLAASLPLLRLLWQRETEGQSFDSPERKAALDRRLREAIRKIPDAGLRRHYGAELAELRRELFGGRASGRTTGRTRAAGPSRWEARGPLRGAAGRGRREPLPAVPQAATRASALAAGDARTADVLREAVILATLLLHPSLLPRFEPEIERLDLGLPLHRTIRDALLAAPDDDLRAAAEAAVGREALEALLSAPHVRIAPAVRLGHGDEAVASMSLAEDLARLAAARAVQREIDEAAQDLAAAVDEGLTWRLGQAAAAAARTGSSENKDEVEVAPNGVRMSRAELERARALRESLTFSRRREPRRPS